MSLTDKKKLDNIPSNLQSTLDYCTGSISTIEDQLQTNTQNIQSKGEIIQVLLGVLTYVIMPNGYLYILKRELITVFLILFLNFKLLIFSAAIII